MKLNVKNVATEFLKDESGQSTTEYVLLLVFVVMAVKAVGGKLNSGLGGLIDKAFSKAETAIEQ
jgi:Flp pilus assembly pilin Flp